VSSEKRDAEFKEYPQLLKFWKHLEKKFEGMGKGDDRRSHHSGVLTVSSGY
jgi:intron-binding protein aquarius